MNRTYPFVLALLAIVFAPIAAHASSPGACPRTLGTSDLLGKPFPSSARWYGSEALAVILRPDGIWRGMGPSHNFRDKLFWWSQGFKPGLESNLKVTGKRLDAESPPADISDATNAKAESLGGWAMLVGVEFPSAGCWRITGNYLGQELSFVVEVRADDSAITPATERTRESPHLAR
jgi:hypothetical protein